MKIYPLKDITEQNYNPVFVNALKQFWHSTKYFQCIGAPKAHNLLLLLNGCKITYTDKAGNRLVAESGDVVYTPIGSEYRAQLSDFKSSASHTVGINFLLYDELGEPAVLSKDIMIFRAEKSQSLPILFQKALRGDSPYLFTQNRILIMELLCALSDSQSTELLPDSIAKGVQYLKDNIERSPSVTELAELCGISEVYFRKQFKEYIGVSPREYRSTLRLEKALSYLEYGEISVQEISDTLGYATVSHFIKEFKRQYGTSPLQYRKHTHRVSDAHRAHIKL